MSYKRPNTDQYEGGPPEKIPYHTQSNIEYAMLNQKFKTLERDWRDRGLQLSKKQKELNDTRQQIEGMRSSYEDQISRLNNLLTFKNEEMTATTFREPHLSSASNPIKRELLPGRSEQSQIAHQPTRVLSNISTNVPLKKPVPIMNLATNFLVRRVLNDPSKGDGDPFFHYKIENETDLPCKLNKDEMLQRYQRIKNFRLKHPTQCNTFENLRIPSRQEVLIPKVFESSERSDRISIWTALNATQERFLFRKRKDPTLHRMTLLEKNMEYTTLYSEGRNNFEKLGAPDYMVPQWFSRFYV